MATDIVLRSVKASALTHAEMDQNWESLAQSVDSILANYTVLVTDQNKLFECDISSGTLTLPTVANAAGTDTDSFKIIVKNINSTSLTVSGNGSETIEGSNTFILLENETAALSLASDSSEWNIAGFYNPNLIGITSSAIEINYNNITTLGVAQASKVMTTDSSNDITSSGEIQAAVITGTTVNASTTLQIAGASITSSAAELNFSNNVTSDIQTQLNAKLVSANNLSDLANATTARTNLNVDASGTDNSTDVTLAGSPNYITIVGQVITRALISLTSHVTGLLPIANGGTNSNTAAGAVTNLGFTATVAEVNAICDGKTLTSTDDKIDNFPAGTQMLFRTTAAPTGWTKLTTLNDRALRLVSGTVGSGGADAFSSTFGAGKTTASHVLSVTEMPSHQHQQQYYSSGPNEFNIAQVSDNNATPAAIGPNTSLVGGGGGHTHNLNNFDLQYADTIEATKN